MIEFNKLQVREIPREFNSSKRYIIGCDPYDQADDNSRMSIFSVYDKYIGRNVLLVKTKRTFNVFVKSLANTFYKSDSIVSDKFIINGKAKRISEIRTEVQQLQGHTSSQLGE